MNLKFILLLHVMNLTFLMTCAISKTKNKEGQASYFDYLLPVWKELAYSTPVTFDAATSPEQSSTQPLVNTTSGLLSGSTTDESHQFHNVPYAKPPVGKLRFMPPEAVQRASDTINASVKTGMACMQNTTLCNKGECILKIQEDCLILEISVPSTVNLSNSTNPPSERLPVLFWIYGGFFYAGSGTNDQQDGRFLSNATNTIVVTSNYRVGPFGFLYYNNSNGNEIPGNQGLMDQQLALQWVQDNIERFGGDKTKVTIFGESAGAQAVMFHLLSKTSKPLFERAIMESNPALFPYQKPKESELITKSLMDIINCTTYSIECLRNATAEDLVAAQRHLIDNAVKAGDPYSAIEPYRPIIDGTEYTEQPLNQFQQGMWNNDKDVIIGTNTQELAYVTAIFHKNNVPNKKFVFDELNKFLFGNNTSETVTSTYEEMANAYSAENNYTEMLASELTEAFFTCPTRALSRFMDQTKENGSIYLYSNAYPLSGWGCQNVMVNLPEVCGYSFHSSEIGFVFRTGPSYGMNFTANDTLISDMFSAYWGDFAHTGNPSSSNMFTTWPVFQFSSQNLSSESAQQSIQIQAPNSTVQWKFRGDICDFWDSTLLYPSTYFETTTTSTKVTTTKNNGATTTTQPMETTSGTGRVLSSGSTLLLLAVLLLLV